MTDVRDALTGGDIPVDFSLIERHLAELWQGGDAEHAVTKAALWNVVAHSTSEDAKNGARDILSSVSNSVPQRTILVEAAHEGADDLRAWISANCHLIGGGQKICSEEITIVAAGGRVHQVPPIVNALLIPDMPVATWWVGDLPSGQNAYLEALLDPADRLIVDSSAFDSPDDLSFVHHLAGNTATRPADLNWSRVEDWRVAAASMFDVEELRTRMGDITSVLIEYGSSRGFYGEEIEARFFATWLLQRLGYHMAGDGIFASAHGQKVELKFGQVKVSSDPGHILHVVISFRDGASIDMIRESQAGALRSEASGLLHRPVTVTRLTSRRPEELITRELGRAGSDRIYIDILPLTIKLERS
jgi:glucose-6-phosphate dehydrogenase assembly protein OpcA